MDHLRWEFAPGALWTASGSFSAPLGKRLKLSPGSYNRTEPCQFHFTAGQQIRVDATGSYGKLLISSKDRPTDFTNGRVWMDTSWVSVHWLQANFRYAYNVNHHIWQLRQYSAPYSVIGIERLLADEDVMVELILSVNKGVSGLTGVHYYSGSPGREYSLDNPMEIIRTLRHRGFCNESAELDLMTMPFVALVQPYQGLVLAHGGKQADALKKLFSRSFMVSFPQVQVFLADTDDEFFHARLSMTGPTFIHREAAHAV